jgi:hypothetical protein
MVEERIGEAISHQGIYHHSSEEQLSLETFVDVLPEPLEFFLVLNAELADAFDVFQALEDISDNKKVAHALSQIAAWCTTGKRCDVILRSTEAYVAIGQALEINRASDAVQAQAIYTILVLMRGSSERCIRFMEANAHGSICDVLRTASGAHEQGQPLEIQTARDGVDCLKMCAAASTDGGLQDDNHWLRERPWNSG